MNQRVLMVGYYGRSNFGDDVLLTVTHRLIQQARPTAHIHVLVDGAGSEYVQKMLRDVTILAPARHGHFDLIVHGGGGVLFDFSTYGLRQRLGETMLRAVGFRAYVAAEKMLRRLAGKPRTSATRRIGLGLGVGGFSSGSPRLRAALPTLADFAAIWVRDTQSVQQLQRFTSILRGDVVLGSDLAFLTQHWLSSPPAPRLPAPRPRLGVALRDWTGTDYAALEKTLAALAHTYEITGFIFDAQTDPMLQQILAPYRTHIWNPETMRIADFAALLATQHALLTSRAHGAICGACLGVPSVIVAIEPKLAQVHAMLPHASVMVAADQPQQWAAAVQKACAITPEIIAADVAHNAAASAAALRSIERWLA